MIDPYTQDEATSKDLSVTSDNYIDIKHQYFSAPDEDGVRLRTTDVWFATKPSSPSYATVDYNDKVFPGHEAEVTTAWSIDKVGLHKILIVDRDDINGLRRLLDELENYFDRKDMEALHESLQPEVDNEDGDE